MKPFVLTPPRKTAFALRQGKCAPLFLSTKRESRGIFPTRTFQAPADFQFLDSSICSTAHRGRNFSHRGAFGIKFTGGLKRVMNPRGAPQRGSAQGIRAILKGALFSKDARCAPLRDTYQRGLGGLRTNTFGDILTPQNKTAGGPQPAQIAPGSQRNIYKRHLIMGGT